MNSKWLILSHAFNMDGRAASQTITDKIPHLLKKGLTLEVLSSISGDQCIKIPHKRLMPWGPSGFIFDFRFLLRKTIGKGYLYNLIIFGLSILLLPFIIFEKLFIGLPNHISWSLPASLVGIYRVKRKQVNLIYSTGGSWSAHLAGYWIWKFTKVKWIVELHDPLYSIYDANKKSREIDRLKWLEKKINDHATLVWWFSEGAEKRARENHTIQGVGFNELAGANPPILNQTYSQNKSKIIFSTFGSLTPGRSLTPFINGLGELIKSGEINPNIIEIHVYGGLLDEESEKTIYKYHLEKLIFNHGRIESSNNMSGRRIIMGQMMQSDILLLMHGQDENCKEYIPSKFYEYLYAKRAILAYPYKNKQFSKLLDESNCYISSIENSSETILGVICDWRKGKLRTTNKVISTEKLVNKIIKELRSVENSPIL